jgi:magnesium transporter
MYADTGIVERRKKMVKKYEIKNGFIVPSSETGNVSLYINPTSEESNNLKTGKSIDEHTLSSALDPDEVPRIEFEPDHFIIIWKIPQKCSIEGTLKFEVTSIAIFIFKDSMDIIVSEEIPVFEGRHFSRIRSIHDVLLRILSGTISHFLGHLKVIDSISNEIKQKVNMSMENRYLLQMFDLSESLVYYLNAISSNGSVLEKLNLSAARLGFKSCELETLEDVRIDNNQCYKQAEIFATILTGLMDARGTVVNNNVNTLLKRLTIINTIFLPLNLLASIGGMSEYSLWTGKISWPLAYGLFIIGMMIISVITFIFINPNGFKLKK